ncbi:hypothetical protein [Roseibium album]|uniref:hypothetical protein n=1 Tax=Roseibium album TaxID=311410 RepID=UPI003BB12B25
MGTGSFGGGSGSFGGGSGGGGGKGSLLRAVQSLQAITRSLINNPDQTKLTREINTLLRDRGRAATFRDLLADGFASELLKDLLAIGERLRAGDNWADIAATYDVDAGPRSMEALADLCIDRALAARGYEVDERYIEQASAAFRTFLASSVGGDFEVAVHGDSAEIDLALVPDVFAHTIDRFLGDLIGRTVEADSYLDLGSSASHVQQAADTLATAIYDRFYEKFVIMGKAERHDVLRVLANNYYNLVAPT